MLPGCFQQSSQASPATLLLCVHLSKLMGLSLSLTHSFIHTHTISLFHSLTLSLSVTRTSPLFAPPPRAIVPVHASGHDDLQDPGGHPTQGEVNSQKRSSARQEAAGVLLCVCLRLGFWRLHDGGQGGQPESQALWLCEGLQQQTSWCLGQVINADFLVAVALLQVTDYRTQFSKWWVAEWKAVAFPEKGLVFDYYVDETQVRTGRSLAG